MTGDLIPVQTGLQSLQAAPLPIIERELKRDPQLASEHTRRTYWGALSEFMAWLDGRPMTDATVEEYAALLHDQGRGQAPATVNHKLSAIRWWANRLKRRLAGMAAMVIRF